MNARVCSFEPWSLRLLVGIVDLKYWWQRVPRRGLGTPPSRLSLRKVALGDLHLEVLLAHTALDQGDTGGKFHLQRGRAFWAIHLEPCGPRRYAQSISSCRRSGHRRRSGRFHGARKPCVNGLSIIALSYVLFARKTYLYSGHL